RRRHDGNRSPEPAYNRARSFTMATARSPLSLATVYAAACVLGLAAAGCAFGIGLLKGGALHAVGYSTIFAPQLVAALLGWFLASRIAPRTTRGALLGLSLLYAAIAVGLLALVPHGFGIPLALCATFTLGLALGVGALAIVDELQLQRRQLRIDSRSSSMS